MEGAALPKGALILVTGATGFIGANVVLEALKAGYKVRGTSRSESSAAKLVDKLEHNPDLSTAIVPDVSVAGAWDEAVKDVDAIIHLATDTSFEHDPNKIIPATEEQTLNILRSAAKSSSVKRFVLTSSSAAVLFPQLNKEFTIGVNDWNEEALKQAWAPPPYTPERAYPVYAASKVAGEKALWKFMQEEQPNFVANAVLPNFNLGRIVTNGGPTGGSVEGLLSGNVPPFPPQYHIDVIDSARIHLIAAAFDSSLKNERIFAFAQPFTFTQMISILKELEPDADNLASPPENEGQDLSKAPNELGKELLKKWYGQEAGYKTMRQSIEDALESLKI